MKKLVTLLLAAVLGVGLCFGLTGCKKEDAPKIITVGITNAAPMNFKDGSGNWTGFDTDLTVKAFTQLGYTVMFKEISWANKYMELNAGTIDCIWNGFTANSTDVDASGVERQRSELVNFSINYMINEQVVVKNKNVTFNPDAPFDGKTVAYEIGSSGDAGVGYIEEDYPEVTFVKKGVVAQSNALQEVNAGTADFAVVDKSIAENAVGGGYTNIEMVEFDYFGLEYYAIGFRKDTAGASLRDQINVLLRSYYESGYLQELCTKYNIEYSRVTDAFNPN